MKKFLSGYVEKVESEKDGILSVAIASDSTVDRHGERIAAEGWDFANFMRNPVLLWAHDYDAEPIGKVIDIRHDGDRILFTPQFAVGVSERAKQIFNLFKEGFLNAFSVGFIPHEWEDGKGDDGMMTRTFTKTELLEISAVAVPANANALVMVRGMKGIDESIVKNLEAEAEIKQRRTDVQSLVMSKEKFETAEEARAWCVEHEFRSDKMDETEDSFRFRQFEPSQCSEGSFRTIEMTEGVKAVICKKKEMGICDDLNENWNADEEISAVAGDTEKMKAMAAWFDESDQENLRAYKLIHHRASDMRTIWRGVSAAMATLLGARGGVEIPEEDLPAVYEHLAEHYKQFGKEPPEFKSVEAQILKDVDLEMDAPIAVYVIGGNEEQITTLKEDIEGLKKAVADNRDLRVQKGVEELTRSPEFSKRVLIEVDKAIGKALRDANRLS